MNLLTCLDVCQYYEVALSTSSRRCDVTMANKLPKIALLLIVFQVQSVCVHFDGSSKTDIGIEVQACFLSGVFLEITSSIILQVTFPINDLEFLIWAIF